MRVTQKRGLDVGALKRTSTEADIESDIMGQKLTETICKLKGDLKTVAERNSRLLRKMTEMQLLLADASRQGQVQPEVLRQTLNLLKPGGKSKYTAAARSLAGSQRRYGDGGASSGGGSSACSIV